MTAEPARDFKKFLRKLLAGYSPPPLSGADSLDRATEGCGHGYYRN
jgi:hypothetical protein